MQRDTHQLIYAILANNASRDAALDFLQEVLVRNVKRQQIQVMERFVAGDGFMLNFLSVMQVSIFQVFKIFLVKKNPNGSDVNATILLPLFLCDCYLIVKRKYQIDSIVTFFSTSINVSQSSIFFFFFIFFPYSTCPPKSAWTKSTYFTYTVPKPESMSVKTLV